MYLSHSVPRLWVNTVIISSSCHWHHYVTLTVICTLPISSLSSLSLQTSVSSVAFCKHQVTQQQVRHPGSVRTAEQTSVAEYSFHRTCRKSSQAVASNRQTACCPWQGTTVCQLQCRISYQLHVCRIPVRADNTENEKMKMFKTFPVFCQDQRSKPRLLSPDRDPWSQDQDLCFCPRGASRPRPWFQGLHHWQMAIKTLSKYVMMVKYQYNQHNLCNS